MVEGVDEDKVVEEVRDVVNEDEELQDVLRQVQTLVVRFVFVGILKVLELQTDPPCRLTVERMKGMVEGIYKRGQDRRKVDANATVTM